MNVEKKIGMQHSIQSDQPDQRKTFSFNILKIKHIIYVHSMFNVQITRVNWFLKGSRKTLIAIELNELRATFPSNNKHRGCFNIHLM